MKKLVALMLALCLTVTLCACGGSSSSAAREKPAEETPETEVPKATEENTVDSGKKSSLADVAKANMFSESVNAGSNNATSAEEELGFDLSSTMGSYSDGTFSINFKDYPEWYEATDSFLAQINGCSEDITNEEIFSFVKEGYEYIEECFVSERAEILGIGYQVYKPDEQSLYDYANAICTDLPNWSSLLLGIQGTVRVSTFTCAGEECPYIFFEGKDRGSPVYAFVSFYPTRAEYDLGDGVFVIPVIYCISYDNNTIEAVDAIVSYIG